MRIQCLSSVQKPLAALCLLVASAGCADDDTPGPQVDQQSAQLAVTQVTQRVQVDLLTYQAGDGEGSATFDCVGGGTVETSGDVNVATEPVSVDVRVSVAYDACATDDGHALDGEVDFSQQVLVADGDAGFRVETILVGSSMISRPDGTSFSCDFDLNVVVDRTGALVDVAGSACGYPAKTFDLTINPHW